MKIKLTLLLSLALALAACGDSSKKDDAKPTDDKTVPNAGGADTHSNKEKNDMTDQNFIEAFAAKDGVQKTESGILYIVLESGDASGASPAPEDVVTAHYTGELTDGTVFDSSYKRGQPLEFSVNGVIRGWTELLQMMKPGDKWKAVIPAELAYGEMGTGPIPGGATLVFDIELVNFVSAEAKQAAFAKEQTEYLEENAKQDGVEVAESGLQYKVIKSNEAGTQVNAGDMVTGHMVMSLIDGTKLADSHQGGQPIDYPVDQVFAGWAEGSKMMKTGESYSFVLPAKLGFGEEGYARGGIPPMATLVLELEVVSVKSQAEVEAEEKALLMKQTGYITDYLDKHKDAVLLESGLVYRVLSEGTGNMPSEEQTVSVHYSGTLIDGTEFDSSYKRGQPAQFPVNGVIRGWVEALQLMKEGAKYELVIPADLAYGAGGTPNIPGGSTLVFTVELLEIK